MTDTSDIRLSALVVAHNEESQLEACLGALRFADEIVIVLDKCTDGSKDIADRLADRVVEGSWEIEGERRNTGIAACKGAWVVEVDADERMTPELAKEIRRAIDTTEFDYYQIPFDNYIGDHLVRYGWGASWGNNSAPRLFRVGHKVWGNQRVHPSLTLNGPRGRLDNSLIHFVDEDISDMLRRLDRYTTAHAADLRASGDIGRFSSNIRRIFSRFYKCYVVRKGYREGAYGFMIALFAGLYPILSYLKARLEEE
ncbi:MAG: glycosyltransferase family 2 protein [Pseudomonadota bacterium]